MNWLRKLWNKYSWIMFLPTVLFIGILIIVAIIGIRYGVILFFQNVPFSIWGSLLGGVIIWGVGSYFKDKISKSKLGFGWHLVNQISAFEIVIGVLGLIILAASIIFIFLPQNVTSAWELIQTIGLTIIFIAFLYAYTFACGIFLRDSVLAFRFDLIWGGVFLALIAVAGYSPVLFAICNYLVKSYLQTFWLGTIAAGTILTLISWFIITFFIIPAFYFQLETNKKDKPNI